MTMTENDDTQEQMVSGIKEHIDDPFIFLIIGIATSVICASLSGAVFKSPAIGGIVCSSISVLVIILVIMIYSKSPKELACDWFGIACGQSEIGGICNYGPDCVGNGVPGELSICCDPDGTDHDTTKGRTGKCFSLQGLTQEEIDGNDEIEDQGDNYKVCRNTGISYCPQSKPLTGCEKTLGEACSLPSDCLGWDEPSTSIGCCEGVCSDNCDLGDQIEETFEDIGETIASVGQAIVDSDQGVAITGFLNNDFTEEVSRMTPIRRKILIGNKGCRVNWDENNRLECSVDMGHNPGDSHFFDVYEYDEDHTVEIFDRPIRIKGPNGWCEPDNGEIYCNQDNPTNNGKLEQNLANTSLIKSGVHPICVDGTIAKVRVLNYDENENICRWDWGNEDGNANLPPHERRILQGKQMGLINTGSPCNPDTNHYTSCEADFSSCRGIKRNHDPTNACRPNDRCVKLEESPLTDHSCQPLKGNNTCREDSTIMFGDETVCWEGSTTNYCRSNDDCIGDRTCQRIGEVRKCGDNPCNRNNRGNYDECCYDSNCVSGKCGIKPSVAITSYQKVCLPNTNENGELTQVGDVCSRPGMPLQICASPMSCQPGLTSGDPGTCQMVEHDDTLMLDE